MKKRVVRGSPEDQVALAAQLDPPPLSLSLQQISPAVLNVPASLPIVLFTIYLQQIYGSDVVPRPRTSPVNLSLAVPSVPVTFSPLASRPRSLALSLRSSALPSRFPFIFLFSLFSSYIVMYLFFS
jgi:hypothetical protein